MRRVFIPVLACIVLLSVIAVSQTRHRSASNRNARATAAAAEKRLAEMQTGRERIAAEIKPLTQFLYLLGGIAKGIESIDQADRSKEASPRAIEQNERNRTRVKESVRSVREGLDKLEASFRSNPALTSHYPYLAGVGKIGATAESQAAVNRFDEAGRSLLKVVNQLTDALVAMR